MTGAPDATDDFIAEVLPAFITEAREQTDLIESLLLQIEGRPDDRGLLDALFRCAHTVKGSAGIFGLDAVVTFTHHVETLLDRLREGQLAFRPAIGTLLLQCNDEIRQLIAQGGDAGTDARDAERRQALAVRLQRAADGAADAAGAAPATAAHASNGSEPEPDGALQVAMVFGPDTLRDGMDPGCMIRYLQHKGALHDIRFDLSRVPPLDRLAPEDCHVALSFRTDGTLSRSDIESAFSFVLADSQLTIERAPGPAEDTPPPRAAAAPAQAASSAVTAGEPRFIRVQADRLDAVIDLLGELVIAGAGAGLLARQSGQRRLLEANARVGQLIEEVRNSTLKMRMVPIGETFSRFRRVVRDTAAELGKDVVLEMTGTDTELDKSVVERIADPLMHLVRNALDHGLEPRGEREAAGKPATGVLRLSARHESGSVLIAIDDDGRGIQRRKVLERAWQRGLLEPGTVPPEGDIDQLVFEPGFSTADTVTNLSGRGVGMDVVRSNIESLRGTVRLSSSPGQGSRIEIRLPLTLAIIDGFLVDIASSRFIFPLESVTEVVESQPTAAEELDEHGRGLMHLRDKALPVISLRHLFAMDGPPVERTSVVVLRSGDRCFGVLADQLLGQHQTVIKPLGPLFHSLRGFSGSSVLGSGEVALIVDVPALCQLAATPRGASPRTPAGALRRAPAHLRPQPTRTQPEGQLP